MGGWLIVPEVRRSMKRGVVGIPGTRTTRYIDFISFSWSFGVCVTYLMCDTNNPTRKE